ncbi:AraC family transcriptional regulator [Hoministercoradaptatus ammoniilyticus]|nr:AraC family transcriptional regulator [Hoministercoradaptatus ammoniilyticus]
MKIYYLESGGVTLIQNGRKAQPITEGIHLYLNKPSQGRVLYQPNIPISYASVLLFEDYIEKNLQDRFTPDDFDYAEVYDWKAFDYNTPEIGTLFLQIRDKLIAGETSRLYYESKVGELLSIVAGNFHKQRQEIASKQQPLSKQEKKALESVRQAIEQNVLNPPEVSRLCKIAAMGQTKLRESFKAMYGVPIGAYIRQAKMRYALLLMSKPNLTIGNIAEHLGYANASKFAATFRKVYGKSPEEYRNQKR